MNKIFLTFVLVSVCLCQEETLIQLENGVSLTNLNKLMTLDYSQLDCQANLLQVSHQLKMWAELFQDEKVIHHEIRLLSTAHKILNQQKFNRQRNSNTVQRAKRVLAALRHNTHKRQHTIYQQWRANEIDQLKHSIQLLQTATNQDESKQCCDRIEQLINKFLDERKHIAKQCGNADVTINIINDNEGKIQVINKKCHESDPDVKINRVDSFDKVIVGQAQQQKKQVVEEVHEEHHEEHKEEVHEEHKEEVHEEHKEEVHHEEHKEEVHEEHKEEVHHEEHKEEEHHEEHHEQTETVTKETVEQEEEEEEETEEIVIEETVTKTTTHKTEEIPDDDDDVVEGELVSAQGVGASGEGGRT
ncbi:unnamed protein product (macronuclear) [Paramecium tetraurelia]|uniref:Uncharacterized protein n=1 Tax=Paramecium tetraurelia TaxID=5888 RepID=A0DQF0_PARTE|nr:uncharacterized protein GSPATT00002667001 [Paramecium tetraurelia]CAK85267.1 unnamed protein product [Paramecium tetraurelia]|eukprot:XP_001452664.1 hypothetical protein (macronuclear) [Paramecium tetraurelia strain d4-2]